MAATEVRFAWLLPDLAMVAACVTLFYCLFLFQGYRKLFRDSDAGWHIRAGEQILATGELPRTDPYSFTRGGQPWFAWEWAADVAAGAVHRAAGLSGVALFYGALIAAGVWVWFRVHWAMHGSFLVACALTPLLLSTCNIHWLARPHTIGWLFLLGAVWWAERRHARFGGRDAAVVAAYVAVWANMHASFFLAVVVALAYAAGRSDERRFFLWAAAVAAVAGLANPYGWRLYDHVFRYLTDTELLSRIGEFQTFKFDAPGTGQIIATVIVGMIGGTLALTQRRAEHFILAVVFSAMAIRSARALPLDALVLLPVANGAASRWLEGAQGIGAAFLGYSKRLRMLDSQFSGVVWAPAVLAGCFGLLMLPGIRGATGFPSDQFPVAAYSHVPPGARLYAPDKFGGYLIYRSAGKRKVFFDGRSDLYGAEFLKQYGRLISVLPGWQKYWNSFGFTHALLPNDAALIPALEQLGWKAVYEDETATLLAKDGT